MVYPVSNVMNQELALGPDRRIAYPAPYPRLRENAPLLFQSPMNLAISVLIHCKTSVGINYPLMTKRSRTPKPVDKPTPRHSSIAFRVFVGFVIL